MAMLSILIKDSNGEQIPVLTEQSLEEIVMNLYRQKCWDITEVTNNSGSFLYKVQDGIVLKEESKPHPSLEQ